MKTYLLLFILCLRPLLNAQTDTIYKSDGEVLYVNITEITETGIKYMYPGENFSNSIVKNAVYKIHYKSGRKQDFSATLNMSLVKGCLDWKKVQISNIQAEVTGLYKIDVIGAKAKGVTEYSSLAKLQDRAYNKIKIETAMLGGNIAYIIEQNTEEAIFGGKDGPSKTPGVTISGLAYSSKKVYKREITEGTYNLASIYALRANEFEMEMENVQPQSFSIEKDEIIDNNGFQKLKLNVMSLSKLTEYTVIYADDKEMILSAIYMTRQGKKTYYNLYLKKS